MVRDQGIACRVRLVESILRERLPIGPDLLAHRLRVAVLLSSLDEFVFHLVEDCLLLLAHGLPQHIGITLAEAGELL